ncbi:hypothetical protein PAPYR_9331 [Paratrimastix pyriformis]|uniref:Uncharacterized protein n=1 Tax=Paratrimastix pyriformis TaxID=342808 RepID=A0ABQ8U8Q4_9EUKA|nr:hypothetical protein PAPYR_9331 [Paratrimastix pyriformis]
MKNNALKKTPPPPPARPPTPPAQPPAPPSQPPAPLAQPPTSATHQHRSDRAEELQREKTTLTLQARQCLDRGICTRRGNPERVLQQLWTCECLPPRRVLCTSCAWKCHADHKISPAGRGELMVASSPSIVPVPDDRVV